MNMNKLTGGLVGLTALLMSSVTNAATVQMSPSTQTVSVGDPLSITVGGVDFLNGVAGGSTSITWDATQLSLTSTQAVLEASINAAGFDFITEFTLDAAAGTLDTAFGSFFDTVPGTSFTLFTLDFVANPPPATSLLDIGFVTGAGNWANFDGSSIADIDVTYLGASVTVEAVPVPAAVWLFGSGLIGLVGVARRKTQLA
jgi:hypothetical protein